LNFGCILVVLFENNPVLNQFVGIDTLGYIDRDSIKMSRFFNCNSHDLF